MISFPQSGVGQYTAVCNKETFVFLTENLLFTIQVFLVEYGFQNWTLYMLNINERLFSI